MNQLTNLSTIIEAHIVELKKPGVASVRPGYKMEDGWPTTQPAIVVIAAQGVPVSGLPTQIEGIPVEVRTASDVEQLRLKQPETYRKIADRRVEFRDGAFPELDPNTEKAPGVAELENLGIETMGTKPQLPYTGPANTALKPVTGNLTVVCHASPDAGWPTLKTSLQETQATLTVGMYDFTSAHILEVLQNAMLGKGKLTITLDNPSRNPTADQTDKETLQALSDALGEDFASAWALVRSNKAVPTWIYPTAYHIKVVVRDSQAVWLSSGNWNNSNQPDFDPIGSPTADDQKTAAKSDRDWHVIMENPELAKTYEAFLKHDFDVASEQEGGANAELLSADDEIQVPDLLRASTKLGFEFHQPLRLENEPMTITPLLTPDPGVYQAAMLKLVKSATTKLYIQLQYIHPSNNVDGFKDLIDAVVEKIADGVDVRIILSQWQQTNGWLERLQAAGVHLTAVKIQNGVHNKGFVVDSKVVALGSQNWSDEGVLNNRDASVIIESAKAAAYYEKIFTHDWTRLAAQGHSSSAKTASTGQ